MRRRDHFNNPLNLNTPTTANNDIIRKSRNSIAKPSSSSSFDDDDEQIDVHNLVGTCPFMCPVEERVQRERLRDLAVFERLHGDPKKSSPHLAVKKFCRTITSKYVQASDVRPLSVLQDTLNYLLNLLHSREYPFEVVYDFIFDRTRSVRQDLSMQNLSNDQVIFMYERMVKFHIISEHKFRQCSGSLSMSSKSYLNMEQLKKNLVSLYSLYDANRSLQSMYQNEAEYRSLYVLLHLQSDGQKESLSLWFRYVPTLLLKSKEMRFALNVLRYFRLGNYKRFFCVVEAEASYLQYCILEPYTNEVRALAISYVNYGGYKLQPIPLLDLSKLLLMKASDLESLCKDCGLLTSSDEAGSTFLPTKQTSFVSLKRELQKYYPLDSGRLKRMLVDMSEREC